MCYYKIYNKQITADFVSLVFHLTDHGHDVSENMKVIMNNKYFSGSAIIANIIGDCENVQSEI